ncbi:MAG: amylo-alpha-1,6-glucosidase [Myxococcota bacterium]
MNDIPSLSPDLPASLDGLERLEWLVTNGLGGFASGTVAGSTTRRYHGLLVAALDPPRRRHVVATRLDESVVHDGRRWELATNRWASGAVAPEGYAHLHRFWLDGRTPVWQWRLDGLLLERRIAMPHGHDATCVQWTVREADGPVSLEVRLLAERRGFHRLTHAGDGTEPGRLAVRTWGGHFARHGVWYHDYRLLREEERGLDHIGDAMMIGQLHAGLGAGQSASLAVAATPRETWSYPDYPSAVFGEAQSRDRALLAQATDFADAPGWVRRLVLAADQFVVRRADGEPTIIAGYPWFGDWGRDTMIALQGLTVCVGRPEIAAAVLRGFDAYVDRGMLPNRFPDEGEEAEYNTVDATLWYVEALRRYVSATGDVELAEERFGGLEDIVASHDAGTRYGIAVDSADGLLRSGEPGVQLTWMDAKVGDHVITPRIGKCVEINALWHNALATMADLAERLGRPRKGWDDRAERVRASFARFWNPELGYCYDVLDGPDGDDATLRPNQLIAVSLGHPRLPADAARRILAICEEQLLTPVGVRTLPVDHPDYVGVYGGDPGRRDGAYHQGTAWAWLLGPFVEAHHRVHGDAERARAFLRPMAEHLGVHGVGTVSEIFDGDAPHPPRGTIAQAWSVAEVLRVWQHLNSHS